MQHTTDNKTALLTKTIISRRKLNVNTKKIWVLQSANIKQISVNARKSIIS